MSDQYTIELPEIEGFEQVLDDEGRPLYRQALAEEYYRGCANLDEQFKSSRNTDARVFILRKLPRRFQFGDVVDGLDLRHLVYKVNGGSIHTLPYYFNSADDVFGGYLCQSADDLKLIEESTEETRSLTISSLNGTRKS